MLSPSLLAHTPTPVPTPKPKPKPKPAPRLPAPTLTLTLALALAPTQAPFALPALPAGWLEAFDLQLEP